MCDRISENGSTNHTSISLPSIRAGILTPKLMNLIKKERKTGFTIAPEAGTDRLRKFINKGITEKDIINTVENAFTLGWKVIKLYFMVGLPSETVEIENGRVTIYNDSAPEGMILDEEYLGDVVTAGQKKVKLRSDEYYVLGDNRDSSLDSRTFGPVNTDYIVGRVWFRGWPVTKIKFFESPDYNI